MSLFSSVLKKGLPIASTIAPFIPGVGMGVKAGLMGANALFNTFSNEGKNTGPGPIGPGAGGPMDLSGAATSAKGWADASGAQAGGSRNTLLSLLNGGSASAGTTAATAGADASKSQLTGMLSGGPGRTSAYDPAAAQSRLGFQSTIDNGQNALNTSFASAMRAGLPGLAGSLQSARAGAVRRGLSTGDLGTSYEGDALSAFQRNNANALGAQATNLYGTQLNARQGLASMDANRAEADLNRQATTYGQQLSAGESMYGTSAGREATGLQTDLGRYGQQLGAAGSLYGTDTANMQGSRNTYLDLLSGNADRAQGAQNAAAGRTAGLLGAGLGALGQFAGSKTGNSLLDLLKSHFGGNPGANIQLPTMPTFNLPTTNKPYG